MGGKRSMSSMEAEAYKSRAGWTKGLAAEQCGEPNCSGCTMGVTVGGTSELAGLFVRPPANPLEKVVLRKVAIADGCSGIVEFTFKCLGWGPRVCVLHRWNKQLGHPRTRDWLVEKGDDYRSLTAWQITKRRRVYGQ